MARRSRTFRIFVSSTFSDLKAERNALQERVFPELRKLCMQHGARFQAIDLRWGVSEIPRCQQVTPRPNFIARRAMSAHTKRMLLVLPKLTIVGQAMPS